ncbi:MAG: serine hydrolase domain-containing protein [Phycisphaerales bacterium]
MAATRAVAQGVPQPLRQRLVNALCASDPGLIEARLLGALRRCVASRAGMSGVPGVQVSLCVDDRPVRSFAWGFADAQRALPMRADTRWRLASLGKPLASMVFLRLVARGVFTLDEPLNPLLEGVAPQVCGTVLTARTLLSHAAGLGVMHPPHFEDGQDPSRRTTLAQALQGEGGHPRPCRDTGFAGTRYTGAGWMLLQHAIEQRTGRSFVTLAEELLIQPLGLTRTSFSPSARTGDDLASAHGPGAAVLPATTSPAHAATGMVSTMSDVVTAARAIVVAARGSSTAFLPAGLAHAALSPQPGADADFTLTCLVFARDPCTLTHGGIRPGLRSTLTVFPAHGIIAACAANSDDGFEVIKPWLGLLGSMARARG